MPSNFVELLVLTQLSGSKLERKAGRVEGMKKEQSELLRTPKNVAGIGHSPKVSSLCNKILSQIFTFLLKSGGEDNWDLSSELK